MRSPPRPDREEHSQPRAGPSCVAGRFRSPTASAARSATTPHPSDRLLARAAPFIVGASGFGPGHRDLRRTSSIRLNHNLLKSLNSFWIGHLESKLRPLIAVYEGERKRWKTADKLGRNPEVRFPGRSNGQRELERFMRNDTPVDFEQSKIRLAAYRPFVKLLTYYDRVLTHCIYQQDAIFPVDREVENILVTFSDPAAQKPWMTLSVSELPDLHFVGPAAGTVCAPRYRFTASGVRRRHITDWALKDLRGNRLQVSHQRRHLPLRLWRAARSALSREIRAEPQARVSAHSLLSRLLALGRVGREADDAAYRIRDGGAVAESRAPTRPTRRPARQA